MGENTPFAIQSREKERDNGHDKIVHGTIALAIVPYSITFL